MDNICKIETEEELYFHENEFAGVMSCAFYNAKRPINYNTPRR